MLKKRKKLQPFDISVVIDLVTHAQILTWQGSNTEQFCNDFNSDIWFYRNTIDNGQKENDVLKWVDFHVWEFYHEINPIRTLGLQAVRNQRCFCLASQTLRIAYLAIQDVI